MHNHSLYEGKNFHPSSRMSILSERHLLLQAANGPGDSGLILSTDAKPRLKWTADLHKRFVEAVNQLGGADSEYGRRDQFKVFHKFIAKVCLFHDVIFRGYSKINFESYGDSRTYFIPFKESSSGKLLT